MPSTVIHRDGRQPQVVFLSSQTVQVVAEPQMSVLDREYAVFARVLIGDAEKFTVLLPRTEPQLDFGLEEVWLERQRVLDVRLSLEVRRVDGRTFMATYR